MMEDIAMEERKMGRMHRRVDLQVDWPPLPEGVEVISGYFDYTMNDATNATVYEGFVAFPKGVNTTLPGALVAHAWYGLGEMEEFRTREMAAHGYVAFALDYYGKDDRPTTNTEAGAKLGLTKGNVTEYHNRLLRGVELLKEMPDHFPGCPPVDSSALVAQGYCSGGQAVLELARIGSDVRVVSAFHPALTNLTSDYGGVDITAVVDVHHAADDSQGDAGLAAFEAEMVVRNVARWNTTYYPNCSHGWTDPSGRVYRAEDAARAHASSRALFASVLAESNGANVDSEDSEDVKIVVAVVSIFVFICVVGLLFRRFEASDKSPHYTQTN